MINGDCQPFLAAEVKRIKLATAFTQHHSNLEYNDKSGAINESYSDIAAVALMEYVRQKNIDLYSAAYPKANGVIPWQIGQTVMCSGKPLRYMDYPSKDGKSADCFRKIDYGNIYYDKVCEQAESKYSEKALQQSYIVHTASGIFNRALYLLASRWGVEKAFRAFALANVKYWTSQADFDSAANGVVNAAQDLGYSPDDVINVFEQVGVRAD
ncbi:M4 family metallopeptidase [Lentisphaerota bacterium ZTH]|nr:M4 family metallopeptidase [Lentisphaerota bacterium]WET06102.1 M4 family metallopeptidase [Lentisphaerota bacterium ZTH]